MAATETTSTLRALADGFPIPSPGWHAFVPEMRACVDDLRAAIDAIEVDVAAAAELERLVETGEAGPSGGDGAVGAARARLDALAAPQGVHPFLDEILPTLEAMRAALGAVAASPAAAAAFAASRPGP